jgi:hypothetical protein
MRTPPVQCRETEIAAVDHDFEVFMVYICTSFSPLRVS